MEEWKDIEGYEGLYQISNQGRVKSLKFGREKIRKSIKQKSGYFLVQLHDNGKREHKLVHRLVAQAFIPNPQKLPEVNHKDEDKSNNSVENLEWCDRKYNANYGTVTIRHSKRVVQIDPQTSDVVHEWASTAECGRNGYSSGAISECCNGKRKIHKGYVWKYLQA